MIAIISVSAAVIGTIISSVISLISSVISFKSYKLSKKTSDDNLMFRTKKFERAQAEKVSAYIDMFHIHKDVDSFDMFAIYKDVNSFHSFIYIVSNQNDLPIYNIKIIISSKRKTNEFNATIFVIPPKKLEQFSGFITSIQGDDEDLESICYTLKPKIWFTDSAGKRWFRDTNGKLNKVENK